MARRMAARRKDPPASRCERRRHIRDKKRRSARASRCRRRRHPFSGCDPRGIRGRRRVRNGGHRRGAQSGYGQVLSSLYLVEYDRYAGNQSVRYLDAALAEHELPSGDSRVFRVRGELTDDGSDYANSNLYGTVHSQLIELVDPDMDKAHTTGGIDYTPSAVGEDAYGCMLFGGSATTPQGYPSTNFFENASIGFTGLTIAAKDTGEETGTISVSYSDDSKPEISGELALTPTFESFSNALRAYVARFYTHS